MATLNLDGYDPVSVEYAPRLRDSGLGTEYEQLEPDGINHNLQKWTVLAEKRGKVERACMPFLFPTAGTCLLIGHRPGMLSLRNSSAGTSPVRWLTTPRCRQSLLFWKRYPCR
jgi:phage-related protein